MEHCESQSAFDVRNWCGASGSKLEAEGKDYMLDYWDNAAALQLLLTNLVECCLVALQGGVCLQLAVRHLLSLQQLLSMRKLLFKLGTTLCRHESIASTTANPSQAVYVPVCNTVVLLENGAHAGD
jgi:hypothetical protein